MDSFKHHVHMLGMPAPLCLELADASFPTVSAGEGPPILFLHGAWADLRIWYGLWKQVAQSHRFLAITQRHFGSTDWPSTKPFSRDVHTDDLLGVVEALNTSLHLVGWSYAGGILLRAASQLPELVRSLTIYEPSLESVPLPNEGELRHAREVFWDELEPAYTVANAGDFETAMRSGIEIVFGLGAGGFATLPTPAQRVFLDNAHTMIPDLKAPLPKPLARSELKKIACPTQIVLGDRTHAQYRLMAEETLSGLSNGVLQRFKGVGHGGPVQMPGLFAEAVLKFVDEVDEHTP
jgi:pimeloyl-ACP methyl ester carboxylesterase